MPTRGAPARRVALERVLFGGLSLAILAAQVPVLLQAAALPDWNGYLARDFELYEGVSRRWLAGGPYIQPWQLEGPYDIRVRDDAVLYPPLALYLFAPFTLLPAALWWVIPVGGIVWVVLRLRPSPFVWPLLALCIAWPPTQVKIITGNPAIWITFAVGMGCIYAWPSVFVLLKPSLFPLALIGVTNRRWWLSLALLAAFAVPFLGMWSDWVTALRYSRVDPFYSIQELPLVAFPFVAWLGRPGGWVESIVRGRGAPPPGLTRQT